MTDKQATGIMLFGFMVALGAAMIAHGVASNGMVSAGVMLIIWPIAMAGFAMCARNRK